jgi:hypothetical protein
MKFAFTVAIALSSFAASQSALSQQGCYTDCSGGSCTTSCPSQIPTEPPPGRSIPVQPPAWQTPAPPPPQIAARQFVIVCQTQAGWCRFVNPFPVQPGTLCNCGGIPGGTR